MSSKINSLKVVNGTETGTCGKYFEQIGYAAARRGVKHPFLACVTKINFRWCRRASRNSPPVHPPICFLNISRSLSSAASQARPKIASGSFLIASLSGSRFLLRVLIDDEIRGSSGLFSIASLTVKSAMRCVFASSTGLSSEAHI
jgi:hypothetical protein